MAIFNSYVSLPEGKHRTLVFTNVESIDNMQRHGKTGDLRREDATWDMGILYQ